MEKHYEELKKKIYEEIEIEIRDKINKELNDKIQEKQIEIEKINETLKDNVEDKNKDVEDKYKDDEYKNEEWILKKKSSSSSSKSIPNMKTVSSIIDTKKNNVSISKSNVKINTIILEPSKLYNELKKFIENGGRLPNKFENNSSTGCWPGEPIIFANGLFRIASYSFFLS